jgi:phage shock protein PspC (stress-responsive transcriptional regulator)
MRKVTVVSLGGNAYQLEEGAYEAIAAYLESASHALASNPDRAEILADLEQAIADKCSTFLGKHKSVVSEAEAAQIIREMGPVTGNGSTEGADAHAGAEAAAASAPGDGSTASRPRRRRLMRLPGEGMMGGVCAGFAAYFDVDVVWIRLAFVLALIPTGGLWFFAWLAMLIVMPAARTPEQIASARGEALNAREVVEMARRKSADLGRAAAAGLKDVQQNLRETFGKSRG